MNRLLHHQDDNKDYYRKKIPARLIKLWTNGSAEKINQRLQEAIQYVELHRIHQLEDDHIEQVTTKLVEGQAKLEATEFTSGMTLHHYRKNCG